jgi:ribokinase
MPRSNTRRPSDRVVVFGSINFDSSFQVSSLPTPGETVIAASASKGLGGKGANQAVAAARAGAAVTFLGAVGDDETGRNLLAALAAAGVDTSFVRQLPSVESGAAMIVVNAIGQNQIVVSSGANALVDEDLVDAVSTVIAAADVVVVQGELVEQATIAAIAAADASDVRVIVNLAPFVEMGVALRSANPLVVNEVEASQLLGVVIDGRSSALAYGPQLLELCRTAVITIGAEGAVVIDAAGARHLPAPVVAEVRDTTGAGDALVGVLAAALARGLGLEAALRAAIVAASLTVTVNGAAESYPLFDLDEIGVTQ